ncbi:macro domain-containing protein [Streptomyces sp. NPDC097619]|uniref:macro domain-containing protein n=1 Tax=Streptomyces sp. NPDC097619 TaxID=3157228 RepID=UPI00331799EC
MSQQIPAGPAAGRSPAAPEPGPLSHALLAEELRALRRPGLAALRRLPEGALLRAASAAGHLDDPADGAAAVEALLHAAVRRLAAAPGPGEGAQGRADPLGRAAAHTFGLLPGRRGASAQDRRKAAAAVYGVTPERFRRGQEQEVISELAGAVLSLTREPAPRPAASGPVDAWPDPPAPTAGPGRGTAATGRVFVHLSAMELLRDIDVFVSSENTHLEMSKTFRPTVSGALRRAAAVRGPGGGIEDDVLARELAAWSAAHGRTGLPVRPGTVVPTPAGALAARGVRRVYHAAVVRPLADGVRYHVEPQDLAEAVAAVFALAEAERDSYEPPLSSICFPLLGAGQGGLPPAKAARWLLWAVREELARRPAWTVHFATRRPDLARLLTDASSAP